MTLARSSLAAKALLVLGIGVILWLMTTGPASAASSSGKVRAGITALTFLVLICIPVKQYQIHTLMTWFSFGAALGFGLLSLFAVGLWACVPIVCVLGYAALYMKDLDASMTWIGAILSAGVTVLMIPL